MDVGMHEDAGSEGVQVEYVEDSMFVHEGLCVCIGPFFFSFNSKWYTTEKANDFFVCFMKWLEVGF